eukprot:Blabericola_migrator_1__1775@NODE_147_length_12949_cov_102_817264_g128_i0_p3_GENE_NODE_147_length_12949_cov_102_817264_g128_i0NODE_147_length_12949_cov_102_817264_g128_i0_p3_ORF_typecomplete_len591_score98_24FlgN/PF05130_12/0_8FlgN/PF05130_12/9_8e03FlgN/PF05130_12/2_1e02Utp12/PF04003_12/9e02Utp12/PF04003_12/4_5e03Utp12/PF04003_12/1_6Utp12/PF04003_12/7_6e02_NODE_147_length_12949_cov_102_817264_g128_i01431915
MRRANGNTTTEQDNVKRIRCGDNSESDDCWVSPGPSSQKASTVLSELIAALQQDKSAFIEQTDWYIRALDDSLDESEKTVELFQQFALAFSNVYKDIRPGEPLSVFLKWACFFAEYKGSSLLPSEMIIDILATLSRFVSQTILPSILRARSSRTSHSTVHTPSASTRKRNVQTRIRHTPPGSMEQLLLDFPLSHECVCLLTSLLQDIERLEQNTSLNPSEVSFLLKICQGLYLVDAAEFKTTGALSGALTALQAVSESVLIQPRKQPLLSDLMIAITSDILDRELVINDDSVIGPRSQTPDGLNIYRCVSLILRFIASTATPIELPVPPPSADVMRHYKTLSIWDPQMDGAKWTLQTQRARWTSIETRAQEFAHALTGHLNWKAATLTKDTNPVVLTQFRQRVVIMKTLITSVSTACQSPWFPSAPPFLSAICSSLIRTMYDIQKNNNLNQALLELVAHSFVSIAGVSQNLEAIMPMLADPKATLDMCACGQSAALPVQDENHEPEEYVVVCRGCKRHLHSQCLPCEDCLLTGMARSCGGLWLEHFCQCFKPWASMGTLARRLGSSAALAPDSLPQEVITDAWVRGVWGV